MDTVHHALLEGERLVMRQRPHEADRRAALDAVDENVSQRRGELGLMSRSANSNVGKIHIARLERAVLALITTT
jgi:hypothetical protein